MGLLGRFFPKKDDDFEFENVEGVNPVEPKLESEPQNYADLIQAKFKERQINIDTRYMDYLVEFETLIDKLSNKDLNVETLAENVLGIMDSTNIRSEMEQFITVLRQINLYIESYNQDQNLVNDVANYLGELYQRVQSNDYRETMRAAESEIDSLAK